MSTTQLIDDEARRDLAANRTTLRRSVWLPLMRKEAKQLAPLMLALLGGGVLLHLLGLLDETPSRTGFHGAALLLIPVLFAVGAGPLLVSQEKEQRSLQWMASLPVRPRSIVTSKLIVSVLGLIVCWCISLAVTLLFCPSISSAAFSTDVGMEWLFWPANTFFLLPMGFALAWIMPTAGSTLVALMLSAGVSSVFAGLANDVFGKNYDHAEFLGWLSVFQVVTIAILTVAALRFGKRSFVSEANSPSSFAWIRKREHSKLAVDRTKTPPLSLVSSLIWQIGWQNRMLWVGALFIVLMGLVSVACGIGFFKSPVILESSAFVGCLGLSWLGVSVFGSDANHGRIRFLAERGVSPFKIWWTRLALPLVCVIFGLLVFFLMNRAWDLSRHNQGSAFLPNEMLGVLVMGVLMTFGLAQWLPQWTRSTLIAFCVSPVLWIISFLYVGFMMESISAPWWWLVVPVGISFAATRIMLCPWMDGRMGLRYWLSQSALLAGALVVPLVPFLITFATYPDMPAALRRELTEEVKRYEPFAEGIELVVPVKPKDDTTGKSGDNFIGFGESVSDSIVAADQQLKSISGPIIYSYHSMRGILKEAQLMLLRMDTGNDEPEDRQQWYRDRYRRSVILLSKLSIHMRMSDRLLDQEVSDQIERWLVDELLQPSRKELFSDEEYSGIVAALGNQTLRHQSRRRAIVVAWYGRAGHQDVYGGLAPDTPPASMATSRLVTKRYVGQATAALLEYLESEPHNSDRFPAKIKTFWPRGTVEIQRQLKGVDVNSIHTPGALWHQDWETKAAKLSGSLK